MEHASIVLPFSMKFGTCFHCASIFHGGRVSLEVGTDNLNIKEEGEEALQSEEVGTFNTNVEADSIFLMLES